MHIVYIRDRDVQGTASSDINHEFDGSNGELTKAIN